jgi:hypothetical protein
MVCRRRWDLLKKLRVSLRGVSLNEALKARLHQTPARPRPRGAEKKGFLAKRTYRKAADGQGWIINYWPGEKYFQDQKAREHRRELAEGIQRKLNGSLAPVVPARSSNPYLLDEILAVCGDRQNQGAYLKVIQDYPEGLVTMAIRETRQAEVERRIKKSKGAFFMDTLKRLSNFHAEDAVAHQIATRMVFSVRHISSSLATFMATERIAI